jgi:hypothetical protein
MLPRGQTNGLAMRFMDGKTAPKPIEMAVIPMNQHQRKVRRRALRLSFIRIESL